MTTEKQHTARFRIGRAAVFILLGVGLLQTLPLAVSGVDGQARKIQLKLVAEYRHNSFRDISADSRLVIFYQTSVPVRSYTLRPGKGVTPNQPEEYDDMLRVVELATGREIARIGTRFFPSEVHFVPNTQTVFYKEPNSDKPFDYSFKLWDITQKQSKPCSAGDVTSTGHVTFLSPQQTLISVFRKEQGSWVGKLTLPDCKIQMFGSPTLTETKNVTLRTPLYEFAVSPNGKYFAYGVTGSQDTFIRDTNTFDLVKLIPPPSGYRFMDYQIFTPDQKHLILLAAKAEKLYPLSGATYCVFFYELPTFKMTRHLELGTGFTLSSSFVMTVSPDSRMMAVANKKEEQKSSSTTYEQAYFMIYDLATGEEIARAAHPPIKQTRGNPFAADIGRLAFTLDGKYLLSSTGDTLVWQIENISK